MESKSNNANAVAKKQPVEKKQSFSPMTNVNVFADEKVDKDEKEQKEQSGHVPKTTNPKVLADSSNKCEKQQDEKRDSHDAFKKKKNWKKNNHLRGRQNRNRNYHERSKYQENVPSEGMKEKTTDNWNDSIEYQPPFSAYIPGNQQKFTTMYPKQQYQYHRYGGGGNAKNTIDHQANGLGINADHRDCISNNNGNFNGNTNSNFAASSPFFSPPLPWVNMIGNNSRVGGIVLSHGGQNKIVLIPSDVGACLLKELLVQKENWKVSPEQYEEPTQGNPGVNGDYNIAMVSPSWPTSTDNQAYSFVQNGIVPSTTLASGHPSFHAHRYQGPNYSPDPHARCGVYAPILNHQQPYSENGSLPPPINQNNGEMGMVFPASYYPVMQQQQYPSMYPYQHPGMQQMATPLQPLACNFNGYALPNGYFVNEEETGPGSDGVKSGQQDGGGPNDHQYQNNVETTPSRAGIHLDGAVENARRPPIHHQNPNMVTPHRGNSGAGSRRVSFSPMVPLTNSHVSAGDANL